MSLWKILLFAAIAGLAPGAKANLKASDFYCRAYPNQPPVIYAVKAASCGKAAATINEASICTEYANCMYVPEEARVFKVKNEAGVDVPFEQLPYEARTKLLVKYSHPASWIPSMITCPKVSDKLSLECPPVEECKGDVTMGQPMMGAYSDKAATKYKGNFVPDAFQAGEGSAQ